MEPGFSDRTFMVGIERSIAKSVPEATKQSSGDIEITVTIVIRDVGNRSNFTGQCTPRQHAHFIDHDVRHWQMTSPRCGRLIVNLEAPTKFRRNLRQPLWIER